MTLAPSMLCSDEDIYVEAGEELATIIPRSQVMAAARDGSLVSTSPWVLVSGVPFADYGVHSGQLVLISGAPKTSSFQQFGPSGSFFVVDSAANLALTLRRPGLASGQGQPPGPLTGTTAGVIFSVYYLDPNIQAASALVNLELNVDISQDSQVDAAARSQLAIYEVLADMYAAEFRRTGNEAFSVKSDRYHKHYDDLLAEQKKRKFSGFAFSPIQSVADVSPYPPSWRFRPPF